jgi:hypothetical protein
MVLTDNKLLTTACAAALTVGIMVASNAYTSKSMCRVEEYYATHSRACYLWQHYGVRPRHHDQVAYHRTRQEFPPVVSYDASEHQQTVTVSRDRQASNDFRPDQFIALQTADDIAKSPPSYGFAGWFVGMFDMGKKHPPIYEAPNPQARARAAAPRAIAVRLDK